MSKFPKFTVPVVVLLLLAGSVFARQTVLYHSQADDGSEYLLRLHLHDDGASSLELLQAPQLPGADSGMDVTYSAAVTTQADRMVVTFEGGSLEVAATDNGEPDPHGSGTLQFDDRPELSLNGIGTVIRGELASPDGRFTVSAQFPILFAEPWAGQLLFGDAGMSGHLQDGLELFNQNAAEEWNYYQVDETAFLTAFSSRILSGIKIQFSFTGGAHPNTSRQTRTLLGTEFGSWYEASYLCAAALHLGWACDDAFVRQQVISQLQRDGASRVTTGEEVTSDTPWLLDRFVLTPNSVTILFDQYEVGAYAEGLFLVEVPYDQLAQ